MVDRYKVDVVECDGKKYITIIDMKAKNDCDITYLINHESFKVRKAHSDKLVETLNKKDKEIRKLKEQKNNIDKLLNIRNFIE